jgi:hypothetical protein
MMPTISRFVTFLARRPQRPAAKPILPARPPNFCRRWRAAPPKLFAIHLSVFFSEADTLHATIAAPDCAALRRQSCGWSRCPRAVGPPLHKRTRPSTVRPLGARVGTRGETRTHTEVVPVFQMWRVPSRACPERFRDYAESRLRPFRRRCRKIPRPLLVRVRRKNPNRRCRLSRFG